MHKKILLNKKLDKNRNTLQEGDVSFGGLCSNSDSTEDLVYRHPVFSPTNASFEGPGGSVDTPFDRKNRGSAAPNTRTRESTNPVTRSTTKRNRGSS